MATAPRKTRKEILDEAEDAALGKTKLMPEEPFEPPEAAESAMMPAAPRRKKVDNYPWD